MKGINRDQFDSETPGQLLGDLGTAQMRVASFGFKDGLDQGLSRPFRTRFVLPAGGVEPLEFKFCKCAMTAQERGGFNEDGRTQ